MSLRRPTVALLSFTFNISPLRDVAQTSDCGTHLLFIFHYKPFMWRRLDARLRHCYFICIPFEESFRHSIGLQYYIGISGGLPPDFPFIFPCIAISWSECALLICSYASCLHLLYLMSELSCEYFHSTHLAC